MDEKNGNQGKYYQDFEVGERVLSAGRTITESDIMTFAGLSGDFNQLHTNEIYAQENPYGKRIAHGLLILSVVSGLSARLGFAEGTALALTNISWKIKAPVMIGDTIQAIFTVKRKKRVSQMDGGFVEFTVQVNNQRGEIVHKGTWTVLVKNEPENVNED
ncbi:MAG: MaoC/PaaZ C-terminal domain-containing protein [Anaerolineales bacterium]